MRHFFTLMMVMLSATTFSQVTIRTESFPANIFNRTGPGRQTGSYHGMTAGSSLQSSTGATGLKIIDMAGAATRQQPNKLIKENNRVSNSNRDRLQADVYSLQMTCGGEIMSIEFNTAG